VFRGQAAVVREGVLLQLGQLEVPIEQLVDGRVRSGVAPLVDLVGQLAQRLLRLGLSAGRAGMISRR
jgi:hypothetical protein